MSLQTISLVFLFIIQVLCYWATYRVIVKLEESLENKLLTESVNNSGSLLVMFITIILTMFMFLSMKHIELIVVTCVVLLIVLVTIIRYYMERGEK